MLLKTVFLITTIILQYKYTNYSEHMFTITNIFNNKNQW